MTLRSATVGYSTADRTKNHVNKMTGPSDMHDTAIGRQMNQVTACPNIQVQAMIITVYDPRPLLLRAE
jgi:hypothetical protein